MNDYSATGNYYTIGHLTMFTGLTDRTIRNYISSGILEGEKINGVWHFTPEQVQDFITHPAVRPSILAKKNAIVYDFLLDTRKHSHQCCIILDLPGYGEKEAMEFFCHSINGGDFKNISFSFDSITGTPRVILMGCTEEVMGLVNGYYSRGEA